MNPWLFFSVVGLIVFLTLVDWKTFTSNLWAGIICAVQQLGVNITAYKLNYWDYLRIDVGLPKIILFNNSINIFLLAIAFMMGILFIQFLPKKYFLQLIHSIVWTFFFRLSYHLAEQNNMIQFIHWRAWMYFYLIPVHMLTLAWIKNTIDEGTGKNDSAIRNSIQ